MQFYAELRQKRDLLTKRLYYNGLKAYGAVWVKKQIDRAYIEKDIGTKYTSSPRPSRREIEAGAAAITAGGSRI